MTCDAHYHGGMDSSGIPAVLSTLYSSRERGYWGTSVTPNTISVVLVPTTHEVIAVGFEVCLVTRA